MSIARIHQYYNELHEIKQFSGESKETSLRRPFAELLSYFAKERNLRLVDEVKIPNSTKQPDGVLIDIFRHRYGYWEAKDAKDDFEKELNQKIKIGYPTDNLLFENGQKAMLIQGSSRETCDMTDAKALLKLLQRFVSFERPEAKGFRQALEIFKQEVGTIAQILKQKMESFLQKEQAHNEKFVAAHQQLLLLCKTAINPNITPNEVNEMIVQHILTGDIFRHVFGDAQYHEENNIAQVLTEVEKTFFTGDLKRSTLQAIQPYYQAVKAQAAALLAHEEKQDFLKTIYENFYQAYNPKGADKLGIVYTPSEIVNFMIDSTEYLLEKYFDKTLSDKNVHILDPATGTGTFITHLIKKISPYTLKYKYQHELHANEVAILPYYIANLNIEYIYKQKMGEYLTFNNICWVDTLDSVGALQYVGKQNVLFGSIAENAQRIKTQNEKRISVVIGNPPYNARQQNYNDQNANRTYNEVDKRIKETFVRNGKAQNQIILYDMYVRFYAWAMDRVDKNGVVAFITNRSFIESKAFDGFRKVMQQEFTHLYIVDLKGDIRQNNYAEQGGNVFNIMTGVAITFFVKVEEDAGSKAKIYYYNVGDAKTGKEKLEILKDMTFKKIPFEKIQPDTKHNWLKQTDNDFEKLLPLIDKEVKAGKKQKAIFKLFSLGVASHRDNWVYDLSKENLEEKMKFFVNIYQKTLKNSDFHSKNKIAWDADLENHCKRKIMKSFEKSKIKKCLFRPFVSKYHYFDRHFNGRLYQWKNIYQDEGNLVIAVNREGSNKPFHCLASNQIIDLHTTGDSQCLPFYYYENGERQDNITDWALELFRNKYGSAVAASPADALDNKLLAGASTTEKAEEKLLATEKAEEKLLAGSSTTAKVSEITKLDIFHYVYAVLHSPDYRKKYELDLKREFPRIPLYEDFWKYAEAGRRLMELHLNYESPQKMSSSFKKDDIFTPLLERKDMELAKFLEKLRGKKKEKELFSKEKTTLIEEKVKEPEIKVNPILKIKDGNIEIDELTTLCGVPAEALAYKLGNRSAIEWVLEQYKPYKSDDKTIQEQFNNYNFEDYKEQVIDLLQKVTWVSVETMKIVKNL